MQSTTSTSTLKIGSQGLVIRELQTLVNQIVSRDYQVVVDGIFGPKTEATIKLCQSLYFLEQDGIVGPKTWKALRAKSPVDLLVLGRGSPVIVTLSTSRIRAVGIRSGWEAQLIN